MASDETIRVCAEKTLAAIAARHDLPLDGFTESVQAKALTLLRFLGLVRRRDGSHILTHDGHVHLTRHGLCLFPPRTEVIH